MQDDSNKKSMLAEQLALDLSNIEKDRNDLKVENGALSSRLNRTLDEFSLISNKNEELKQELLQIQKEMDNIKLENEENMMNIKGTLGTFIQNIPVINKENEAVLSVMFSMLNYEPEEVAQIEAARKKNLALADRKGTTKGIFGLFGKKN